MIFRSGADRVTVHLYHHTLESFEEEENEDEEKSSSFIIGIGIDSRYIVRM